MLPLVHSQYWYLRQTRPGQQVSFFLLSFVLQDLAASLCSAQANEGPMEDLGEGIGLKTATNG